MRPLFCIGNALLLWICASVTVGCDERAPDRAEDLVPYTAADAGVQLAAEPRFDDLLDQWQIRYLGVGEQPIEFGWPAQPVGDVTIVELPIGRTSIAGTELSEGATLSPEDLANAVFVEERRDPGSAGALRFEYQTAVGERVEVTVTFDLEVHPCDELAASPLDPERYARGTFLLDTPGSGQHNVLDPEAALPHCEAAHRDYPEVGRFMAQLARCHWRLGNYRASFELSQRATDAGFTRGQVALGNHYRDGLGVEQDLRRAFELHAAAAEKGDPEAQHSVARLLQNGDGVEQDDAAAVDPLTRSAKYGFHWAQYSLGRVYREGRGLLAEPTQALFWFRESAEQNNGFAHLEIGRMALSGAGMAPDARAAERSLLRAAEVEVAEAYLELGLLYRDGAAGVPADLEKAVDYLTLAVRAGLAAARDALASIS